MGHQVNFYAAHADIPQLQQRISEIEPMWILHDRSTSAEPRVIPSLHLAEDGQRLLFYFLVREE